MKLVQAVMAHLAAEELAKEKQRYALALALVQVRRGTQDAFEFYRRQETELVREFAQVEEGDTIKVNQAGGILMREGADPGEYEARRRELNETPWQVSWEPLEAPAPEEIRPAVLEALEGFVVFRQEGRET